MKTNLQQYFDLRKLFTRFVGNKFMASLKPTAHVKEYKFVGGPMDGKRFVFTVPEAKVYFSGCPIIRDGITHCYTCTYSIHNGVYVFNGEPLCFNSPIPGVFLSISAYWPNDDHYTIIASKHFYYAGEARYRNRYFTATAADLQQSSIIINRAMEALKKRSKYDRTKTRPRSPKDERQD